jgi:hypothetical protein
MLTKILASHRKATFVLAFLLILAIPVPHQIVPAWPMRVIDQNGRAVSGIATTQTWRHPVYHPQMLAETRRSDFRGRLTFPERTAWSSGLRYLYGLIANVAQHGASASFGPDVWVYAKKDADFGSSNVYTRGQTPPDTLVIHRYGVCPATGPAYQPAAAPTGAVKLDALIDPSRRVLELPEDVDRKP